MDPGIAQLESRCEQNRRSISSHLNVFSFVPLVEEHPEIIKTRLKRIMDCLFYLRTLTDGKYRDQ